MCFCVCIMEVIFLLLFANLSKNLCSCSLQPDQCGKRSFKDLEVSSPHPPPPQKKKNPFFTHTVLNLTFQPPHIFSWVEGTV